METVASIRAEKNSLDNKQAYTAKRAKQRIEQRIVFLKEQIKNQKQSIIECLELDYFDSASGRIQKVLELKNTILELTLELNK